MREGGTELPVKLGQCDLGWPTAVTYSYEVPEYNFFEMEFHQNKENLFFAMLLFKNKYNFLVLKIKILGENPLRSREEKLKITWRRLQQLGMVREAF